jgi:hypothetical protein
MNDHWEKEKVGETKRGKMKEYQNLEPTYVGYIVHLIFWGTSEEIYKSCLHVLRKSRRKNILFWAKLVPRLPNY